MRTLLIDNNDSFTFNLFHLLGEVNGEEPLVLAQDAGTWEAVAGLAFDNLVISSGPGGLPHSSEWGFSTELIRRCQAPLLAIGVGHHILVQLSGGRIAPAPEPMHGRLGRIFHKGEGLFSSLESPLRVARYHSFLAMKPLPSSLRAIASSSDELIMAVRSLERPRWGLDFHPASVASEGGRRLLENFRDLSRQYRKRTTSGYRAPVRFPFEVKEKAPEPRGYRLHLRELPQLPDAEAAFLACFSQAHHSFWLDSARIIPGLSRWSFMGSGHFFTPSLNALQAELKQSRLLNRDEAIPFPFRGGWIGWIGYEARKQCGYDGPFRAETPDLGFLWVERFLVLDHQEGRAWLAHLTPAAGDEGPVEAWFDRTASRLAALKQTAAPAQGSAPPLEVFPRHQAAAYHDRIEQAQESIRKGESYGLCLTNRFEVQAEVAPLTLYRHLRRLNPAPHSAYLKFGNIAVASSSPERFLAASATGVLQAKPIKGTAPRYGDPEADLAAAEALRLGEKDRAENLMIVDLLRHDLGRVARLGSVRVPSLMAIESYATVHQLVSTVEADLAPGLDVLDAVRAAFPPGSMTGAPKRRSLEILDHLEGGPRGLYSGALGWISLDGAADFSVVIRALIQEAPGLWSLGTGGAITALSNPEAELEEMYLKARAPLSALSLAATGDQEAWFLQEAQHDAAE